MFVTNKVWTYICSVDRWVLSWLEGLEGEAEAEAERCSNTAYDHDALGEVDKLGVEGGCAVAVLPMDVLDGEEGQVEVGEAQIQRHGIVWPYFPISSVANNVSR